MIEFLRRDTPTAEGGKIGLLAHTLLCGLCQIQVTLVRQIRTLVEMTLEAPVKKRQIIFLQFRLIVLRHKPVLLVRHSEAGQYFDSLAPCGVHGLVFLRCDGEQLRQRNLVAHGYVGVLADDTAVFHCQQWEFRLQSCGFQYISHRRPPFIMLRTRRRLMM